MHDSNATAAPDDAATLTRHIEARYHASHREVLPGLIERAHRVEMVHAGVPGVPVGLGDLLEAFGIRLSAHMAHEEEAIFPAIRAEGAVGPADVASLRAEHDANAGAIADIRRLTGDIALPEGACRTWTALYDGLRDLIADLETHMRLEDERLFAPAGTEARHG